MNAPDVETRHSHGSRLHHDHEYGDIPHDHQGSERTSGATTTAPDHGKTMFDWGFVIAILGGLALLDSSRAETACSNILVRASAVNACGNADLEWTAGLVGLLLGIGLIIAGSIMRHR